ncbi:MAG TPA: superoxide dismutase family protein [Allosphingosinicella sp.]|jgi:Cu-Zn family superoxide dismutase
MKRIEILVGAAALALAGCATSGTSGDATGNAPAAGTASADIRDAAGQARARATASEAGDSVRIRVEAAGLAQGAYGVHVHTTGRCDPPDFASAGPHWNPTGQQHGKDNPHGMHRGDLPNLLVGTDGRGSFEYTIRGATLGAGPNPVLDADGAAVVVHAKADDLRTDPSGNSGARIACGVLRPD